MALPSNLSFSIFFFVHWFSFFKRLHMRKNNERVGLRIVSLIQGSNRLELCCQAADFGERETHLLEAGFDGNIAVSIMAEKSDNKIVVTLSAQTTAHCTCDRCLALLSLPIHGTATVIFTCETVVDEAAITLDDYRSYNRQSEYLDLADDVCDALLLALPMKITCTNNPYCRVFQAGESDATHNDASHPINSEWQEALDKLKQKYSS
uniref:DUF177 domain-containing protein n=1 Tax=Chlorobium chlorochromatii (strain CaD3) TaxID=340177 RepID=Q3AQ06_CHLCH